jgi:hypothetical protein
MEERRTFHFSAILREGIGIESRSKDEADERRPWHDFRDARSVYAYHSVTSAQQFNVGDTLTAPEVLPGFAAPVADLFAE